MKEGRKQGKRVGGKRWGGEIIKVQSPFKKVQKGTFLVVKTPHFYRKDHRFHSKIPHAVECGQKKKKKNVQKMWF